MARKIFLKHGLLLLVLLAVLALAVAPVLAESVWQTVGNPGFSSASPCGDSLYVYNGTPYVLCGDADGGLTVMEYAGGLWQQVGGEAASSGTAFASFYVYNGTPYVAYGDDNITVMEYTGGSWQMVGGVPASTDTTSYKSLYVYNGIPYLAYTDLNNGCKATVMEYAGGKWRIVGNTVYSGLNRTPVPFSAGHSFR